MQDMREIPVIVNEKIEQTDLHGVYDLSSSIDKVSFKKNSMSLGLVVLEQKLLMWTCTSQSDAIMSAD